MSDLQNQTIVVNKMSKNAEDFYDIYIGRPTILGNPFVIGKDGNRTRVIERYRLYFKEQMQQNREFRKAVERCRGKRLGCWCKPKPCHGDVIAEYLNNNEYIATTCNYCDGTQPPESCFNCGTTLVLSYQGESRSGKHLCSFDCPNPDCEIEEECW